MATGERGNFLYYKHTTDPGNSGGPVLLKKENKKYVVVGIHKGTSAQHNYCLLLRSFGSELVNNLSIKLDDSLNAKDF